jgi:hypothetical protein
MGAVVVADPASDLTHVEALLEAGHPARTRFVTADELHAAFEAERAHLRSLERATELDVGAALHRVLARLGDAHLVVALPVYQPDAGPVSLLPVMVRGVEGRALVDAATVDWPLGTELLAIDGVPVDQVYAALLPLVPVDGLDPEARQRQLEHDLTKWYSLGYGLRETYPLTVRLPGGEVVTTEVPGADRTTVRELHASRHVAIWWGIPGELPTLERVGATPVLHLPTFGVADQAAFRARVDELFATIAPDEPLVVDLRGNEGGLRTNANAVLDHLLPAPYREWTAMRAVTRELPERLRSDLTFLAGSDRERLRPLFRGPRGSDGWTVPLDPYASVPRPDAHHGPVRVLVDGRTGSAANGFALILAHDHPDATLVGERLGGGCDAHVGELPVVWASPESGVRVMFSMLALTHVAVEGCVPGRGLSPDVWVRPTVAQFVAGTDPWLAD